MLLSELASEVSILGEKGVAAFQRRSTGFRDGRVAGPQPLPAFWHRVREHRLPLLYRSDYCRGGYLYRRAASSCRGHFCMLGRVYKAPRSALPMVFLLVDVGHGCSDLVTEEGRAMGMIRLRCGDGTPLLRSAR